MEIIKASDIVPDLRRILVLGVPFSGKTSLAATAEKPMLAFAFEDSTEARLAGLKDVDIVRCYDTKGDVDVFGKPLEGVGMRRFDKNWTELLCAKTITYKTVLLDPVNYLFDDKILDYKSTCVSEKKGSPDTLAAYGKVKEYGIRLLKQMLALPCRVIMTAHVRLNDDETVGHKIFLPSIEGSTKDSMPGRFHAVFYTEVDGGQHKVRFAPDMLHLCGVKVPIGKEGLLKQVLPFDIQKIIEMLRG